MTSQRTGCTKIFARKLPSLCILKVSLPRKDVTQLLNSKDISKLRSDVAKNCHVFLAQCEKAGYRVIVTGTVRDDEYQLECYRKGTGGKPPATFHSVKAGLAFDICQNVKGHEYDDPKFWAGVSVIGKKIGFSWGGDWRNFVDKPHFQWDQQGKYHGKDIIAGEYPGNMPLYQEVDDMTESEVMSLVSEMMAAHQEKNYQKLSDIPTWGLPTVEKLLKRGFMQGSDGSLNLSYELLRTLVINDRAGLYHE